MKVKTIAFVMVFSFALSFAPHVFAENVEVLGRVENLSPDTVGSTLEFKDSATQKVVLTKVIDPSGGYAVSLPQGTYDISIIPPAKSGLSAITKSNQQITSNTATTFVLPTSQSHSRTDRQNTAVYILAVVVIMLGIYIWYLLRKKKKPLK